MKRYRVLSLLIATFGLCLGSLSQAQTLTVTDNLKLWLKADAITGLSDNDPVASWPDSSGNANNASQGTGTEQPAYKANILAGKPVVRFDGTDDYLTGTLGGLPAPFTIFVIGSFANANQPANDYDYFVNIGNGSANGNVSISRYASGTNSDQYYCYNGSVALAGPVLPGQTFQVLATVHKTAAPRHNLYINGQAQSVADYGASLSVNGSYHIGRYQGSPPYHHPVNGDIAEVLVYGAALSDIDRESVERYLGSKYLIPGYEEPGTVIQLSWLERLIQHLPRNFWPIGTTANTDR